MQRQIRVHALLRQATQLKRCECGGACRRTEGGCAAFGGPCRCRHRRLCRQRVSGRWKQAGIRFSDGHSGADLLRKVHFGRALCCLHPLPAPFAAAAAEGVRPHQMGLAGPAHSIIIPKRWGEGARRLPGSRRCSGDGGGAQRGGRDGPGRGRRGGLGGQGARRQRLPDVGLGGRLGGCGDAHGRLGRGRGRRRRALRLGRRVVEWVVDLFYPFLIATRDGAARTVGHFRPKGRHCRWSALSARRWRQQSIQLGSGMLQGALRLEQPQFKLLGQVVPLRCVLCRWRHRPVPAAVCGGGGGSGAGP